MSKVQRTCAVFILHSLAVLSGLFGSALLRFDFQLAHAHRLLWLTPVLIVIRWLALHVWNMANSHWRYTGISDLKDLLKATVLGSFIFYLIVRLVLGVRSFPSSIYALEAILSFLAMAGLRVAVRLALHWRSTSPASVQRKAVLVVGAGSAASLLLRELERMDYVAIGLLDDDSAKWKTRLGGVPVLGPIDELPSFVYRSVASEILIAIPSASRAQMLRITDICRRSAVPFRVVPGLSDLLAGRLTVSELREVDPNQLLGREPVRLETDEVEARLAKRVVMVTGAAGSIGSELCKQIAGCRPRKLICVDQAETPLFDLQRVLAESAVEIVYSVTDITDSERVRQLLLEHKVTAIFHAAAYKHVPMTEANPYEGLKNNVFGLLDLVEIAENCGCEDFLLISSDKAVRPSSLMGCTKRLGEMILGSRNPCQMRCVSVRFGNVLGSQGSVIPLFREQIRTRGYVTVTHPEMTRFFMTISEAVSLVLQAFIIGKHGNILVLDMGQPVRIVDLAKSLIKSSGVREEDVKIVYTGMRPGEKLHEELFYESEVRMRTPVPKVALAQMVLPSWGALERRLQELRFASTHQTPDRIRTMIRQIIPEYQWTAVPERTPSLVPSSVVAQAGAPPRRFASFA